jgi:hypothetical protein
MITGGKLETQRISLSTQEEKQARKLAQILIGTSSGSFYTTSPFQERVNVAIQGSTVVLTKSNGEAFTYEETKQTGRLLRTYSTAEAAPVEEMLLLARKTQNAPFTFFYPSQLQPLVEITFLLNRILLQINVPYVKKLHTEITQAITEKTGNKYKVFSNHYNMLSINNDSMGAIFLSYDIFCRLGDALVAASLMPEAAVEDFAIKASMHCLKCMAFLEARQLCVDADETFEAGDSVNSNAIERRGLKPLLTALSILARHGSFYDLPEESLEYLFNFLRNPPRIEKTFDDPAIRHTLRALIENYPEEICQSVSKTGQTLEEEGNSGLLSD